MKRKIIVFILSLSMLVTSGCIGTAIVVGIIIKKKRDKARQQQWEELEKGNLVTCSCCSPEEK